MKKTWSKLWNRSTQARKQRKYVKKAPLHIRHRLLSAPLSKELRKEHGIRNHPVRSGDTVKVKTGQFKGTTGKVSEVSLSKVRIYVEGAKIQRTDGSESFYPIHPSNVEITKLDLSDEKRAAKVEAKKQKEAKK